VARVRALWAVPEPPHVEEPATAPVSVPELLSTARVNPSRRGVAALAAVAVVAALVAGVVVLRGRPSEVPLVAPAVVGESSTPEGGPEIVIDVAGRVRRPGLVRLPLGSRVDDALRAAGGVLPGTQTVALNRARKLMDGEQLLVGLEPGPGAGGGASAGGLLNLNLATVEDFDALPGIGPVLAQRIVDWRTEHGRFASVDQLREVSGIGEAKYSSMKSKVTV